MPEKWIALDLISTEHVIPEELGGRIITLTCKKCNNTHGTTLDSHLIQMIRSNNALAGVGCRTIRSRMHLGGRPRSMDLSMNAATNTLEIKMRRGHPADPSHDRQFFRDNPGTQDNPITIRLQGTYGYIPCRADLALLRIGYLAMFKNFGYEYILSPAASVVRQIVVGYLNPPEELERIVLQSESAVATRSLAVRPLSDVAVLVVITLVADRKPYYRGVVMPSRTLEPNKVIHTLCSATAALHRTQPAWSPQSHQFPPFGLPPRSL